MALVSMGLQRNNRWTKSDSEFIHFDVNGTDKKLRLQSKLELVTLCKTQALVLTLNLLSLELVLSYLLKLKTHGVVK